MADDLIIPVGTVLLFEYGEYSDFGYCGPFHVVKEINREREADAYRAAWKPNPDWSWDRGPSEDGFPIWLVKEGFIADVPLATSWYIGGFGRFKPA